MKQSVAGTHPPHVIGTDGIIAYAEVNPDYTQRPDPTELLPVLDKLRTHSAVRVIRKPDRDAHDPFLFPSHA